MKSLKRYYIIDILKMLRYQMDISLKIKKKTLKIKGCFGNFKERYKDFEYYIKDQ